MAGILNINNINDINSKKFLRKLSFDVGENFAARVINLDKLTGEVLLKLLDGWQFSAKLKDNVDMPPGGIIKFEVEGFEDGKILLKMLSTDDKKQGSEKSSMETLFKQKGMNVSKDDYPLLDKMIKHNIPLTRENISNIKTLVDFQNKIKLNVTEENVFIDKYIQSKGIEPNGIEGNNIKNTLKGFFNELKNISQDDIITLFENNIDLTEENIKSFNDIFKGSSSLYSEVKEMKDNLSIINNKIISYQSDQPNMEVDTNNNSDILRDENPIDIKNQRNSKQNIDSNNIKTIKSNSDDKVLNDVKVSSDEKIQIDSNSIEDKISKNIKLNNNERTNSNLSEESLSDVKSSNNEKNIDDTLNKSIKKEYSIDDIAQNIKEQVSNKTEEMKTIIKTVLEHKSEMKPEAYNNLIQALDKNINDFKVFNSISNQYYYLDLPINFNNDKYNCKLMIKDERKKGKKIDSTDVKIAASVNTVHMGIVDAYIKVKNSNMDVDLKCENKWVKLLAVGKDKILSGLSSLGYNINIEIQERQEEMNITNCREFFGDNSLGMINIKV